MEKRKLITAIILIAAILLALGASVYLFGFYLPEANEKAELERLMREYYASKLERYREENEAYGDYEVDVAFLGDSLTDGYDVAAYYPQYVTVNRGIGGETTYGLAERMDVSLYELKPKVAVMLIGGNNLGTMLENYEDILRGMSQTLPDTKVVLVSLTSMGKSLADKNKTAAYNNAIIKKLAEKYSFEFVDLYTPLLDLETGEIRAEYTSDGAHLTPEGYRVFTDTLTPTLKKLLGR